MQCYCPPSTYGPPGAMCTNCPADSYCPDGTAVKGCPDGAFSPAKSSSKEDCLCPAGKYPNSDGECKYCKEAKYCPGDSQMRSCRSGYTSDPGSKLASDCKKVCVAGEFGEPGDCKECEKGFYCPGGVHPVKCTDGANAPPGSTKWSDCKCKAGTFQEGDSFEFKCKACPANSFCPGGGAKTACPAGKKSDEGATGAGNRWHGHPSGTNLAVPHTLAVIHGKATLAAQGLNYCLGAKGRRSYFPHAPFGEIFPISTNASPRGVLLRPLGRRQPLNLNPEA